MTEATVINLFTVLRVFVIGGFLLVLPLITRKGLLFGAYVGEECVEGDAARGLMRRWNLGCVVLMASALAIGFGISLAGRPVTGNLTATAFLLLASLGLYLRTYYVARAMAPPETTRQAELATAPLELGEPKGAVLAKITLGICLLAGLATVVYAMVAYDAMHGRSVTSVMLAPSFNLVICPFLALLALLTTRAKRSLRAGSGGRSAEVQDAFRAAIANLLSATALFSSALMTFLSVQIVRMGTSLDRWVGFAIAGMASAMVLFLLGGLIWVITKYGQGGARLEQGSAEAHLTNGLADNTHWVWGVFYVNKTDPSIMVEKRFGLGYTINLGNGKAVVLVVTFLVLILGLTAFGLIEAIS